MVCSPRNFPTRRRAAVITCRSCEPIPAAGPVIRSPLAASAASPMPTRRSSVARTVSSTSRTNTCGRPMSCAASPMPCAPTRQLRLIAVVPLHPDQDGRLSKPPNLVGRQEAIDLLRGAAVIGWRSMASRTMSARPYTCTPRCVSSMTCGRRWDRTTSIDVPGRTIPNCRVRFSMTFATSGTRRSSTATVMARVDSPEAFGCNSPANTSTAGPAMTWTLSIRSPPSPPSPTAHETCRRGTTVHSRNPTARPAPTLRRSPAAWLTLAWATPLYRSIYDPDARPRALRRRHQF